MGRPKRELQAIEEKQKVDVTTNAMLDLKVTKEDVLSVLIQEEEDRLNAELKIEESNLNKLEEKEKVCYEQIAEVVYSNKGFNGSLDAMKEVYTSEFMGKQYMKTNHKVDRKSIKTYEMNRLEGLAHPEKSTQKYTYLYATSMMFNENAEASTYRMNKDYTDAEGFSGVLHKSIKITLTDDERRKIKTIINKFNKLAIPRIECMHEINELSYRILTLDSDRKFKNKLTKTILKSADLNKLFLK
jgi:hypothetical protein